MRPCLLAGPARADEGVLPGDEVAHLHRVAHGVDVRVARSRIRSFTTMLPLTPSSSPACLGQVGVRRDADGQHHHVGRAAAPRPSAAPARRPSVLAKPATECAQRAACTPCLPQLGVDERWPCRRPGAASAAGARWTMVTSTPSSRRFSAISRPMKPPPATTARRGAALVRQIPGCGRVSSTVRRVNTGWSSTPGQAGLGGPGARGRGSACHRTPRKSSPVVQVADRDGLALPGGWP